jgi:REP element-mobilizing transposase RayT
MFRKPEWADIVEQKIFEHREKGEYLVHRHVIMPDHLHVILTPGCSTTLERAAQLIKGGASYDIGRAFQTRFPVWQPGFTQHLIRDRADYESRVRYVDANRISFVRRMGSMGSTHGRWLQGLKPPMGQHGHGGAEAPPFRGPYGTRN